MLILIFSFVAVPHIFCSLSKQTNKLKQIGKDMYRIHLEAVNMTKKIVLNPKPIGDHFPKQLNPLSISHRMLCPFGSTNQILTPASLYCTGY